MNTPLIYEPFIAQFTGELTSFTSANSKLVYTLHKPFLKVRKGDAYMVEYEPKMGKIRLIPVVIPRC